MQPSGNDLRERRPLSPHLGIYKPQISTVLSILHRATGIANYVGLLLAALWVCSAGFVPEGNGGLVAAFFSTVIGKIFLFGWTFSVFYHLCNGIRHLFWDIGKGFALPVMCKSGLLAVIAAALLTALCWFWALG